MFEVIDKTTGEVFTVYGLNGTHFLCYNPELDYWFYKYIEECRPMKQHEHDQAIEVYMDTDAFTKNVIKKEAENNK